MIKARAGAGVAVGEFFLMLSRSLGCLGDVAFCLGLME